MVGLHPKEVQRTMPYLIAQIEEKHSDCYAETTELKARIQVLASKFKMCRNNFSMAFKLFQTPLIPVWFKIHTTLNL